MNSYRIAFEDSHNGQTFTFAIVYTAKSIKTARVMGSFEFPNCKITDVRLLEKDE